jgi:hypothetical protein
MAEGRQNFVWQKWHGNLDEVTGKCLDVCGVGYLISMKEFKCWNHNENMLYW